MSNSESILIRVGVYDNNPIIYKSGNGTILGIYAELIDHIAEKEEWNIQYVFSSFSDLLTKLEDNSIDIMTGIAFSEERNEKFIFNNETILSNWGQVSTKTDSKIENILDLEGKKIGVVPNDIYFTGSDGIRKLLISFNINATYFEYDSYGEVLKAIENKSVDAGVTSRLFLLKNQDFYNYRETPIIFSPINLKFAFNNNSTLNSVLIPAIDHELKNMKQETKSLYYEILNKYLEGYSPTVTIIEEFPLLEIFIVFASIILLLFLTISFNIILNNRVKKKTRQLSEEKERAESADKAKSLFVANISHELRTPLNILSGFLDLLVLSDVTDDQKKFLEKALIAQKNLQIIIEDLIDLNLIMKGKLKINEERFQVKELENFPLLNKLTAATEKGLKLTWEIDKTIPDIMIGDQFRINQVLSNLIENAIKFTFIGEIFVKIELFQENENHYELIFMVKDTGIGIDSSINENIFEPFFQGTQSDNFSKRGMGLGLPIVKNIVDLLQGELWFDTEIDKGTNFYIKIPFKKFKGISEPILQKKVPDILTTISNPKFLIVDDIPDNIEILEYFLADLTKNIDKAVNGQEAFECFCQKRYDLVLMDIKMPIMDGIETVKLMREYEIKNKKKRTPIIAVTAYAMDSEISEFLKLGFSDFLGKPIDRQTFMELIEQFISKK